LARVSVFQIIPDRASPFESNPHEHRAGGEYRSEAKARSISGDGRDANHHFRRGARRTAQSVALLVTGLHASSLLRDAVGHEWIISETDAAHRAGRLPILDEKCSIIRDAK
jgi:hypothetical protein